MARNLAVTLLLTLTAACLMAEDLSADLAKLKDKDPKVRQKGVVALGKMGDKAKSALPQIIELINEKETVWVMTKALEAVAEIGPDETAIKPATPFLGKGPDIRTYAVDVFVKLGDKGVPALSDALKDASLAEGACEALIALGPKGKAAKAALSDVMKTSKSQPVREKAAKALQAVSK